MMQRMNLRSNSDLLAEEERPHDRENTHWNDVEGDSHQAPTENDWRAGQQLYNLAMEDKIESIKLEMGGLTTAISNITRMLTIFEPLLVKTVSDAQSLQATVGGLISSTGELGSQLRGLEEVSSAQFGKPSLPSAAKQDAEREGAKLQEMEVELRNAVGELIDRDVRFEIQPTNSLTPNQRAAIAFVTPKYDDTTARTMTRDAWLTLAERITCYYSSGGNKPITSLLDNQMLQDLVSMFHITYSEYVSLPPQQQVFAFLKAFWTKPTSSPQDVLKFIEEQVLVPVPKGTMQMQVHRLQRNLVPKLRGTFSQTILEKLWSCVGIEEWQSHFQFHKYESYTAFFDHVLVLAKDFDISTQNLVLTPTAKALKVMKKATGTPPRPDGSGTAAPGGDKPAWPGKKLVTCDLCGETGHYALPRGVDFKQFYSETLVWSCPNAAKNKSKLAAVYKKKQKQALERQGSTTQAKA